MHLFKAFLVLLAALTWDFLRDPLHAWLSYPSFGRSSFMGKLYGLLHWSVTELFWGHVVFHHPLCCILTLKMLILLKALVELDRICVLTTGISSGCWTRIENLRRRRTTVIEVLCPIVYVTVLTCIIGCNHIVLSTYKKLCIGSRIYLSCEK